MGRQPKGDRVIGVYDRRVVYLVGSQRKAEVLRSPKAAEAYAEELRDRLRQQVAITVADAVERFIEDVLTRALPQTGEDYRIKLHGLLRPDLPEPLSGLTKDRAEELYKLARTTPWSNGRLPAVATHRARLKLAKIWGNWLTAQKLLRANPFAEVKPVGKEETGKDKLLLDQQDKFESFALRLADEGEEIGVAAAWTQWCGGRASEIACRKVGDVDRGGRLVWVARGKTKNARRYLVVPRHIQPYILRLIAERRPNEPLFPATANWTRPREWLTKGIRRICRLAGVPEVCAHSLRGSVADRLAAEAGLDEEEIAGRLGQGSGKVARRHYLMSGALEEGNQKRLAGLLESARPSKAEAIAVVLRARGIPVDTATQARLLTAAEEFLDRWLVQAPIVSTAEELS